MNKRIFELIQAQNGFRGLVWTEEDKREFAELLIQEFLRVGEDYSEDFYHFKDEIMKHFGVE